LEHGASLSDLLATPAGLSQKALKLRVQMQGVEAVCRMMRAVLFRSGAKMESWVWHYPPLVLRAYR